MYFWYQFAIDYNWEGISLETGNVLQSVLSLVGAGKMNIVAPSSGMEPLQSEAQTAQPAALAAAAALPAAPLSPQLLPEVIPVVADPPSK